MTFDLPTILVEQHNARSCYLLYRCFRLHRQEDRSISAEFGLIASRLVLLFDHRERGYYIKKPVTRTGERGLHAHGLHAATSSYSDGPKVNIDSYLSVFRSAKLSQEGYAPDGGRGDAKLGSIFNGAQRPQIRGMWLSRISLKGDAGDFTVQA